MLAGESGSPPTRRHGRANEVPGGTRAGAARLRLYVSKYVRSGWSYADSLTEMLLGRALDEAESPADAASDRVELGPGDRALHAGPFRFTGRAGQMIAVA